MPANEHSSQALSLTHPTDEQVWLCLKRLITFDEPLNRFERIQDLLARYITNKNSKPIKLNDYLLLDQDYLFQQVFGSSENIKNSCLINIALALEDITRFSPKIITINFWLG